jgi:DnaA-homolog protein
VAEQLTFELADAPAATFANFLAGRNAEAVDTLARLARRDARETGLVLWGASGAGKTHLLKAAVTLALEHGREARFLDDPSGVDDVPRGRDPFVAVDGVDRADEAAQGRLFTLYNALAAQGGQLVAAASAPPALMALRDDLRTRLGWGLVFEIVPLADAEKPGALAAFAQARGFRLAPDAIAYLLAHGRRDMASLVRTLTALDRYSLALQRPITVPLIREWLQREMALPSRPLG